MNTNQVTQQGKLIAANILIAIQDLAEKYKRGEISLAKFRWQLVILRLTDDDITVIFRNLGIEVLGNSDDLKGRL